MPELTASVWGPIWVQPLHREPEDTGRTLIRSSEDKLWGNHLHNKEQNPDSNSKIGRVWGGAKSTEKKLRSRGSRLSSVWTVRSPPREPGMKETRLNSRISLWVPIGQADSGPWGGNLESEGPRSHPPEALWRKRKNLRDSHLRTPAERSGR